MPDRTEQAGIAALSTCEGLLLALNDRKILPGSEMWGILRDAAATHENAVGSDGEIQAHQAAAELIKRDIAAGNSVRWP